jgi:hypothetical protein
MSAQEARIGGRRPKLTPSQKQEIIRLVKEGTKTAADTTYLFQVHPSTVSRLLSQAELTPRNRDLSPDAENVK